MVDYVIQNSLAEGKAITIMYIRDAEITQRHIKVLKIQGDFIRAMDLDKQQIRTFKKDNILSAMVFPWEGYKNQKKYEKV